MKNWLCKKMFGYSYDAIKEGLSTEMYNFARERGRLITVVAIHEARSGERIYVDDGFPIAEPVIKGEEKIQIQRPPRIYIDKIPTHDYMKRFAHYKQYFGERPI